MAFTNGEFQFAGTLTLPESSGPVPAVVMITGYGRTLKAVVEEARSLGVRAVIDKPFKINQITEAIREIIPHAD